MVGNILLNMALLSNIIAQLLITGLLGLGLLSLACLVAVTCAVDTNRFPQPAFFLLDAAAAWLAQATASIFRAKRADITITAILLKKLMTSLKCLLLRSPT